VTITFKTPIQKDGAIYAVRLRGLFCNNFYLSLSQGWSRDAKQRTSKQDDSNHA
jgi:hypothetical protein